MQLVIRIQRRNRFVDQQQGRLDRECARKKNAGAFSAGQNRHRPVAQIVSVNGFDRAIHRGAIFR